MRRPSPILNLASGLRHAQTAQMSPTALLDIPGTAAAASSKPSERRVHRRIGRTELPAAPVVRIPHQPAAALVDISAGGALIEVPFQLKPDSQITIELVTPHERVVAPFRLLRCHVAALNGGILYQAAGIFERTVRLPPQAPEAPSESERLMETLREFRRQNHVPRDNPHAGAFEHLLTAGIAAIQRGDPPFLVSRAVRAQLTRLFPSLAIKTSGQESHFSDPTRSARFFGLDFLYSRVLTMNDRRVLRACAQLLAVIEDRGTEGGSTTAARDDHSKLLTYSVSEWQQLRTTGSFPG